METLSWAVRWFSRSFAPDKCYYYIPDGPVFLEEDSLAEQEQVFRAVMAFIERKRQTEQQVVSHLCINPRWEQVPSFVMGFQESSHYNGSPRDPLCIDLNASEDAILAQMKPKGRYNSGSRSDTACRLSRTSHSKASTTS
jgi:lipid II:glycine glycyltransferase (peptidoglycan interpeptide bridge formation enzyme)